MGTELSALLDPVQAQTAMVKKRLTPKLDFLSNPESLQKKKIAENQILGGQTKYGGFFFVCLFAKSFLKMSPIADYGKKKSEKIIFSHDHTTFFSRLDVTRQNMKLFFSSAKKNWPIS